MTRHTKGQWVTDGATAAWSILDANNQRIASVWRDAPQAADNARLIAAAPDLLAALEKLVSNWDSNHIPSALDDLSPPNLDIEAARAAIALAKGQAA